MQCPYLVQLKGICKSFPGVRALNNVDFDLKPGEVHVLIGENGAGKSTLMKILSGNYMQDSGEIILGGKAVTMDSPKKAEESGISIIHQEFNLVPQLTVEQNIFLGHEPRCKMKLFPNRAVSRSDAGKLLERVGLDVGLDERVEDLGVAQKQLVELAKALSLDARVLIMDEPTAALSSREIESLFGIIRQLTGEGVGIIYISHRLGEVHEIGDRVTVLRDGQGVGTMNVADVVLDELVRMMVGRDLSEMFVRSRVPAESGRKIVLKAERLCVDGLLDDISLEVREGEIVGLAGLVGSGRTEFAKAVFGVLPVSDGHIELFGERVTRSNPRDLIRMGVGLVPEDRKDEGIIQILSVQENITMASLGRLFPSGIVKSSIERRTTQKYVDMLRIMTDSLGKQVCFLSGGNQQKVVVGKWLCSELRLIIFDEPTRGVDVGAKAEIHRIMDDLVRQGVSILMISSDLPEVLGMSDRIYVVRSGRTVREFARDEASQEEIIRHAMGGESCAS